MSGGSDANKGDDRKREAEEQAKRDAEKRAEQERQRREPKGGTS